MQDSRRPIQFWWRDPISINVNAAVRQEIPTISVVAELGIEVEEMIRLRENLSDEFPSLIVAMGDASIKEGAGTALTRRKFITSGRLAREPHVAALKCKEDRSAQLFGNL